jgi:hypothetical protein
MHFKLALSQFRHVREPSALHIK